MILPPYSEFSREQDKIYSLPLDRNYLITGPPGTGKTIIALFRASMLEKSGKKPVVLMHSKLLWHYTSAAAEELGIKSTIFRYHTWFKEKYRSATFSEPPKLGDWEYNWPEVMAKLFDNSRVGDLCLVVDEGQDLPNGFYEVFGLIAKQLTVFGDENQRMTNSSSTIEEIQNCSGIKERHELTKNYRNTVQVAKVAACYYCGLDTGIPEPPEKMGPQPVIQYSRDGIEGAIRFIANYANTNKHKTIGIFTPNNEMRSFILEQVASKAKGISIGTYSNEEWKRPLPSFHKPGIVVVNYASAKGLEFDTVFIPGIRLQSTDTAAKMQFYVLTSRARTELYMQYSSSGLPNILSVIPPELVQYTNI